MNKERMKNLKTIIFVFLVYQNISYAHYNFQNSINWIDIIKTRELLINQKLTSMKTLLENDYEIKDIDIFISEYPNVMYIGLKCKYADAVVDILQVFYEIISHALSASNDDDLNQNLNYVKITWIKTTLNHFFNTKRHFVKMIHILFYFYDKSHQLRSSDQSLLKSLLSINLFMHYNLNEKQYFVPSSLMQKVKTLNFKKNIDFKQSMQRIRTLTISIIQMIGLVENFRYKNCYVSDPFTTNLEIRNSLRNQPMDDTQLIQTLLETKLCILYPLLDVDTKTYNNIYNDNMYDPEYLLFKNIVHDSDIMAEIVITNPNKRSTLNKFINFKSNNKLKTLYTMANQNISIQGVLEFQNTLFEVIAHVMYNQLHCLLADEPLDLIKINHLISIFHTFFSEIMPNNCLTDVCNEIRTATDFLDSKFKEYCDSEEYKHVKSLKDYFKSLIKKGSIYGINKNQREAIFKLSASTFILSILDNDQFKSFNQVTKLLSYESYTNEKYKILNVNDHLNMNNEVTEIESKVSKQMIQFRYQLFAFRTLLVAYEESTDSSIASTSNTNTSSVGEDKSVEFQKDEIASLLDYLMRCSVHHYELLGHDQLNVLQEILFPLLIRFQYTKKHFFELSKYDFVSLEHNLLLTICNIENHLLNNYARTDINLIIYTTAITSDGKNPNVNELKNELMSNLKINTVISSKNISMFLMNLFDKFVHDKYLQKTDREIQFYWKGSKCDVFAIFTDLTRGVVDLYDFNRYQWIAIVWYVAKLLKELKYLLEYYSQLEQISLKDIQSQIHTKAYLQYFMNLDFPKCIKSHISHTTESIISTLNEDYKGIDKVKFNASRLLIDKCLGALSVNFNFSISYCDPGYLPNIYKNFKLLLISVKENEIMTLIFEELCSSMALLPIYEITK